MRDPFTVLGVDERADDSTIRRRYLALVREFPPDREPERFQDYRAAYEALSDERKRLEMTLLRMVLKDMPKGAADTLRGRVREIGRTAAVEETMDSFQSSELGAILPEPMLRQLCEDMVARAAGGPAARRGRL